jgi:hypothetical protein
MLRSFALAISSLVKSVIADCLATEKHGNALLALLAFLEKGLYLAYASLMILAILILT